MGAWRDEARRRIAKRDELRPFRFTLTDLMTGESRMHLQDQRPRTELGSWKYAWLDGGNWTCDCNRGSVFERDDADCAESRYALNKVEDVATGYVVWWGNDRAGVDLFMGREIELMIGGAS